MQKYIFTHFSIATLRTKMNSPEIISLTHSYFMQKFKTDIFLVVSIFTHVESNVLPHDFDINLFCLQNFQLEWKRILICLYRRFLHGFGNLLFYLNLTFGGQLDLSLVQKRSFPRAQYSWWSNSSTKSTAIFSEVYSQYFICFVMFSFESLSITSW